MFNVGKEEIKTKFFKSLYKKIHFIDHENLLRKCIVLISNFFEFNDTQKILKNFQEISSIKSSNKDADNLNKMLLSIKDTPEHIFKLASEKNELFQLLKELQTEKNGKSILFN